MMRLATIWQKVNVMLMLVAIHMSRQARDLPTQVKCIGRGRRPCNQNGGVAQIDRIRCGDLNTFARQVVGTCYVACNNLPFDKLV